MKSPTPILLLLANIPALAGLLCYGWGMKEVLLLYWLETVVIGLFSILKTMIARVNPDVQVWLAKYGRLIWAYRVLIVILISILVGVYALITGIGVAFMLMVSDYGLRELPDEMSLPGYLYGQMAALNIWFALKIICLSHAVSFFYNFIGMGEYRTNQDRRQTEILGRRVSAIVFAAIPCLILFAVFISIEELVSQETMALLRKVPAALLIVSKTYLDYQSHRDEHGLRSAEKK